MSESTVRVLKEEPMSAPEPPNTPLAHLKRKIADARAKRYFDHPVKGVEEIVIRFGTVGPDELAKITERRKDAPRDEQAFLLNADILIASCLGIYERDREGNLQTSGQYLKAGDEPLTFATLNLVEDGSTVEQVAALFTSEGDVIGLGDRIVTFSGYTGGNEGGLLGE